MQKAITARVHTRYNEKYPWRQIVNYYRSNPTVTLHDVMNRFNVSSPSVVSAGLQRHGVQLRNPSESKLPKGWRKLVKVVNKRDYGKKRYETSTRLLSLPKSVLRKLGFEGDERLFFRWIVEKGKLRCLVTPYEEGNRLMKTMKSNTRLLSLPSKLLKKLQINPSVNLLGKWVVSTASEKKLFLEVKVNDA